MRVHPALLLVLLALTIPLVVELRTMAVWVGIELSIAQTAAVGAVLIGALVVWALFPAADVSPEAGNG
ncbi:hypothetical protein [Halovivax sp.]|uniref:hypothetical protein n=1 Tax=Halovivax sp. TaxID=1935978 RepID=UPI0025B850F4|nr:hypothetical protein [Halovivax sp.]